MTSDSRGPKARIRLVSAELEELYPRLLQLSKGPAPVSPGVEWLLDNHFAVRRALAQVERGFTRGFARSLPGARPGSGLDGPRAYSLAVESLHKCDFLLDVDALADALAEDLQMAELWSLPLLLRLVLLEAIVEDAATLATEPPSEADGRVSRCVRSLLTIGNADWSDFFERASAVHRELCSDPSGDYEGMEFATRDRYRKALESLAQAAGVAELTVAQAAVEAARAGDRGSPGHVGHWLVGEKRAELWAHLGIRRPRHRVLAALSRRRTAVYLGGITGVAALHLVAMSLALAQAGVATGLVVLVALLSIAPVLGIGASLVDWIVTLSVAPRPLPKLDLSGGIGPGRRTLVVVPVLFATVRDVDAALKRVEQHYLANSDPDLRFAILSDFADAGTKTAAGDGELLARARAGIAELNDAHGHRATEAPFHLLHRERVWSERQLCFMGWERKRGKLEELNRMLRGDGTTTFVVHEGGDVAWSEIQYVVTLDADTVLPRGAARRLVETLAHPLNQAQFAADGVSVVAGYTVLQPRCEPEPGSMETRFARVHGGDGGYDIYTRAVSDVYQDLFGEGIFVGKGIYDVDAFRRATDGSVPTDRVLSHDLLEGLLGRAGLVTDIVVYEDYPPNWITYARRMHRWVRGDWQLLPWLAPRVPLPAGAVGRNRLSLLARWKIADNLRRSLMAPSLLALAVLGWGVLPGSGWLWTGLLVAVLATPMLTDVAGGLVRGARPGRLPAALAGTVKALPAAFARWPLRLSLLPHEAFVCLDAIVRAGVRTFVTGRHTLRWKQASHAMLGSSNGGAVVRATAGVVVFGVGVAVALVMTRPAATDAVLPLAFLWAAAPAVVTWTARVPGRPTPPTGSIDRDALRRLARRTWAFFETYVGPGDHWLPPDNVQHAPGERIAHRTSPTNIGMGLLATLSAYDLGYIDLLEFVVRQHGALETMSRMERYRGHFLNWYDTSTLDPMTPRYVSSVDSGNLAAALWVVQHACLELAESATPLGRRAQGLLDSVQVLAHAAQSLAEGERTTVGAILGMMRERIAAAQENPSSWHGSVEALIGTDCVALDRALLAGGDPAADGEQSDALATARRWAMRIRSELESLRHELEGFVPWLDVLAERPASLDPRTAAALEAKLGVVPSLGRAEAAYAHVRERLVPSSGDARSGAPAWCRKLRSTLGEAGATASQARRRLADIGRLAGQLVAEMDFGSLYDPKRKLLYIGYDVNAGRLDAHHYDLLASEARVASLIAIAKGDVPLEHWSQLGRPLGHYGGTRALLSWSGTMFEYLMPTLVVSEPTDSLLGTTARAAVRSQQRYAARRGVPWGISESAYAHVDAHGNYQYRAFGVPTLGFKRGLERDLVIAPYASVLALAIDAPAVSENVASLEKLGALSDYGLYEAIDFTRDRLPSGARCSIVHSHMSHHQGMAFVSLATFLGGASLSERMRRAPEFETVRILLHERAPGRGPRERAQPAKVGLPSPVPQQTALLAWPARPVASGPDAHLLSNGRFGVIVTATGAGHSWWRDRAITRPRPDATLEDTGAWILLEDRDSGERWPLGRTEGGNGAVAEFSAEQVRIESNAHGLHAELGIVIAPDEDVELRRVRISNPSGRPRRLHICSYAEMVVGDAKADVRHPAFAKLFVQSEVIPDRPVLVLSRRARERDESQLWVTHTAVGSRVRVSGYEVDRARFVGRGRSPLAPVGHTRPLPELPRTETTLDPVMVLEVAVMLEPAETYEVTFATAAGASREGVLDVSERFASRGAVDRVFGEAAIEAARVAAERDLSWEDLRDYQRLLSAVVYPRAELRAAAAVLSANELGQSSLWKHGISGDLPIILVKVRRTPQTALVSHVVRAHGLWAEGGLAVDLVILDEEAQGYVDVAHERLLQIAEVAGARQGAQDGGVFVVRAAGLHADDLTLLFTVAAVALDADTDVLSVALERVSSKPAPLPRFEPPGQPDAPTASLPRRSGLRFDNGLGGFDPDTGNYVIHLAPGVHTPAPWANVIANPGFGCLVSESGAGYTWAGNSGLNRLTEWFNDPVCDPVGEAIYIRDELDGEVWSPTPAPAPAPAPYEVEHAPGVSIFRLRHQGLDHTLEVFVAPGDPIKVFRLRLGETWGRARRLTVTLHVEWVLGVSRQSDAAFLVPRFDANNEVMTVRNPYNEDFASAWAFVAASEPLHGLTGDRQEFLGRLGGRASPEGLGRIGLSGAVPVGGDPCATLQVHVDLGASEQTEIHFILGQVDSYEGAVALASEYRDPAKVEDCRRAVEADWKHRLDAVQVQTPEPDLDLMLNRWLPYQNIVARLWGRTGLYQSSGAFGFRDQLQDVMATLQIDPSIARAQILNAAAHQYPEGDVMHWWHPPSGKGLRSRCSDDLGWLPFVAAHYVEATGDAAVLQERVPFVAGEPLRPDELERFDANPGSVPAQSLYEHCLRALDRAATRGASGLPLIGTGDWNDGMNQVGPKGIGESTWLGWFLHVALIRFAEVAEELGRRTDADRLRARAREYEDPLRSAWDGAWYRRASDDAGRAIGSASAEECRIDSIAQSWAVISGVAPRERAQEAMDNVWAELVDAELGVVRLLRPPFDKSVLEPGYIKGYPPGVRENGAQYTHAAVWAAWAYAELEQPERTLAILKMILPTAHAADRDGAALYRVEPYVLAADVYTGSGHAGRGGWTWYTGSAAWAYRCAIEQLLGIRLRGGRISVEPNIPAHWPGYRVRLRDAQGTAWDIEVRNGGSGNRVQRGLIDGRECAVPVVLEVSQASEQVRSRSVVLELADTASPPE